MDIVIMLVTVGEVVTVFVLNEVMILVEETTEVTICTGLLPYIH